MKNISNIRNFQTLSSVFLALGVIGLLVWVVADEVRRSELSALRLPVAGDLGVNADKQASLRQSISVSLASAPLDQKLLAQFLILSEDGSERAKGYPLLANLGWRSTAAQQLLLAEALEGQDLREIMERSDGLLRRGRYSDELISLMLAAEQDPAGRRWLVGALRSNPPWAGRFFGRSSGLESEAALRAHGILLGDLMDAEIAVGRNQLRSGLSAMVDRGLFEEAYSLFERSVPVKADKRGLVDPDFTLAFAVQRSGEGSHPFEWTVTSGPGINSRLVSAGDKTFLNLRWDGRGNPLLLRQFFRPQGLDISQLLLTSRDGDSAVLERSAQIFVSCADRPTDKVRFIPAEQDDGSLLYRAERPLSCDFAKLEVLGLARGFGNRELNIQIDRISFI
ncbi:hypothetical protein FHS61_003174 [Altererythrobacter atlanticus]|uniref:Uncharacterized protein n=1 Tax=Croceibacterium atlanticum TaxID=1267766 RepID=A0A0F7KQH7_9SPHN|nr:hypothetical protein [Croceibacterium atlanticum]AKH41361.1 hypothetical protein WYH_00297 [Croceibacterium atlanticum]MBB5734124.1 hypothetical protein [Croceibacterium atlanticum]